LGRTYPLSATPSNGGSGSRPAVRSQRGEWRFAANLVIAGCSDEGPFTIRFADVSYLALSAKSCHPTRSRRLLVQALKASRAEQSLVAYAKKRPSLRPFRVSFMQITSGRNKNPVSVRALMDGQVWRAFRASLQADWPFRRAIQMSQIISASPSAGMSGFFVDEIKRRMSARGTKGR